jgi:pSer/pThr/pTyr-binding forkhead associated (FHA) protein
VTQGKIPLTFQIYSGGQLVRTEELTQDIIKVGKLQSSHLRIDDDNVSRMHAVIEVQGPDEVHIIDLGSASGTIVNGKKVNKAKLRTGDEVQLGDTKVIVEIGRAAVGDDDDAATRVAPIPTAPAAPAAAKPAAGPPPMKPAAAPAAAAPAAAKPAAAPTAAKPAAVVPNPFAAQAAIPSP